MHENQLVAVPADVPFAQAALLGCGVVTGAGAVLNTADVQAGDSVVIIGAGGVGLNAVNGALIAGATTIIAIDIADDKLAKASEFGATHLVNSKETDPVAAVLEITGRGADAVFDFVGTKAVAEQGLEMAAPGGGLYLIGVIDPTSRIDVHQVGLFWDAWTLLCGCISGAQNALDVDAFQGETERSVAGDATRGEALP